MAVLVAISIPIFTSQLEKSREAADEANIRAIYAQLSADVMTETKVENNTNCPVAASYVVTGTAGDTFTGTATYTMTQQKDGTANKADITIGGVKITSAGFKPGTCTITVKSDGSAPTITWGE